MAKIETGRYGDLLRRFLALKGAQDVSAELAPELSPVFVLEDCRTDWQYLKGEHLISCHVSRAASAGNPCSVRFVNPQGNTSIATFNTFWYSVTNQGADMQVLKHQTLAALATAESTHSRDSRYPSTEASSLVVSSANTGAVGTVLWAQTVDTTYLQRPLHFPYVLAPGNALQFTTTSNNVILRLSTVWHERPVSALELS